MNKQLSTAIQTYTGIWFDPFNPKPENIRIEDIAHALSNICRFTGMCRYHYSVAQHSVYVSFLCDPEHALHGLLHDAAEAYITDIASPLKRTPAFEQYRHLENIVDTAIRRRFNLGTVQHPSVKEADIRVFYTEQRDIMRAMDTVSDPYHPGILKISKWTPEEAEKAFLVRFNELYRNAGYSPSQIRSR